MFSVVGMAKMKVHATAIILSAPLTILIPYFYMKYEPASWTKVFEFISQVSFNSAEELKNSLGLFSIAVGVISLFVIRTAVYSIFLHRAYKINMNISNMFLLLMGFVIISLANYSLIYPFYYRIGFAALTILLYFLLLSKEERGWGLKIINEKILRRKWSFHKSLVD